MSYYKLDTKYAFRGWKRRPYALRIMSGERTLSNPYFFSKEDFLLLLCCNGEENVDEDALSEKQQIFLHQLNQEKVIHKSNEPMGALEPYQRYHVYPSIYLQSVHWSITGKCNYKCRHCLLSAPNNCHPQLPLEDCLHIIEQISKCGVRQIDITGGEPLVRSDFLVIAKALTEHKIHIRLIFTNASLLNEEVLEELERMGQHPSFQISYDGVGHHSWLRGIPGAEEELLSALKLLHKRKIHYSCAMCIHKGNADSLSETVRVLANYGCSSLRLNTPQELGIWKEYSQKYALSWMEAWDIYKAYIPEYFKDGMPIGLELDGFFRCRAHSTRYTVSYVHHAPHNSDFSKIPYCESIKYNAYIDAEGRLVPCMGFSDISAVKDKFPSLLSDDMGKATWDSFYSQVAKTTIQQMIDHNPECCDCEHIYRCCGGCMVEGTTPDGDFLNYDPHCCWFHKSIGEAAVRAVADAAIAKYASGVKIREDAEDAEKRERKNKMKKEGDRAWKN